MHTCSYCGKAISNKGSFVAHEMCCYKNPNRINHKRSCHAGSIKKGNVPWNKGKKFDNSKRIEHLVEDGSYLSFCETHIRRLVRQYLIIKNGNKCSICGTSKWLGKDIPLVCDHVDGSAENNTINNFRLICNNCDATLPTFKGRNKGKGRLKRYE